MAEEADSNSVSQATITSYGTLQGASDSTGTSTDDEDTNDNNGNNDNYGGDRNRHGLRDSQTETERNVPEASTTKAQHTSVKVSSSNNDDQRLLEDFDVTAYDGSPNDDDDDNDTATPANNNNDNNNSGGSNHDDNHDPLNVKELALNFDYLMYKINDRIKLLSERAQASALRTKENTELTIMEIDRVIQFYYEVAKRLDEISNDFSKAEQISLIVDEFVPRVRELEAYFGA